MFAQSGNRIATARANVGAYLEREMLPESATAAVGSLGIRNTDGAETDIAHWCSSLPSACAVGSVQP